MTYTECMEFINGFGKSGKPQKNLERFRKLTKNLGNPHENLKFIHIAGTNGKGSVCEYISESLHESGFKVGKFTSPFIFEPNERIEINGNDISNEDMARLCEKIKTVIPKECCEDYSQFEIFTAMGFLYFAENNVDYVVLETGIGGLLDSTNIVNPTASVITFVDYDHCNILGDNISEIALHKAGIIKQNCPTFSAPYQHRETLEVLKNMAEQKNSELKTVDNGEIRITKNSVYGTEFYYKDKLYKTIMGGEHQPANAALAIEVLEYLNVASEYILRGLKKAKIPARMEVVNSKIPVIADGGHNPSGTLAAAELIKSEGLKPVLICGMLSTKDCTATLKNLLEIADYAVFTDGFSYLAEKAEKLCEIAKDYGVEGYAFHDETEAVKKAFELYENKDNINSVFICGSLYLPCKIKI